MAGAIISSNVGDSNNRFGLLLFQIQFYGLPGRDGIFAKTFPCAGVTQGDVSNASCKRGVLVAGKSPISGIGDVGSTPAPSTTKVSPNHPAGVALIMGVLILVAFVQSIFQMIS